MFEILSTYQQRNNQKLHNWLKTLSHQDDKLTQAMKYALLIGGKRLRPSLVYITGEMLGCKLEDLDTLACAIECIHAYSLIHDDLPSMDNDHLRRNMPTCHIKFDEATAILAGDGLQSLAFTILAQGQLSEQGRSNHIKMFQVLAQNAGKMCLGQSLDLAAENNTVTLEQLEEIHNNKTGALIKAAVMLGALAAGERSLEILEPLEKYAMAIGLAFQVQDDILDVTSSTEILGKPKGSDQLLNKSTYPSLLGLENAKQKAQDLLQKALLALEEIPFDTSALKQCAQYMILRQY